MAGEEHKADSEAAGDGVELAGENKSSGLSPRVLRESSGELGVYTGALGVY